MAEKAWKTYAEAAVALGLSVEGARQRARREHWRKMLGNDGRALVMLPDDARRAPGGDAGGDAPGDRAEERPRAGRAPAKQPAVPSEIEALHTRIAELRADLDRERETARAEVDRERAERISERDRAGRLSDELGAMARELARVVEDGAGRERELRERLADAERAGQRWWPFKRIG